MVTWSLKTVALGIWGLGAARLKNGRATRESGPLRSDQNARLPSKQLRTICARDKCDTGSSRASSPGYTSRRAIGIRQEVRSSCGKRHRAKPELERPLIAPE